MKKQVVVFSLSLIAVVCGVMSVAGCRTEPPMATDAPSASSGPEVSAARAGKPVLTADAVATKPVVGAAKGHKTIHGGSLNAITTCEVGHAEVRVDEDTLTIWFVGGGSQTTSAERVKEHAIPLSVALPDGKLTKLVLAPRPLELAGEKVGDCSRFVASAPWLNGVGSFIATSTIAFKGQKRSLRIEYPKGYDPD